MPKNRIFSATACALLVPLVVWAQTPPPQGGVEAAQAKAKAEAEANEAPTEAETQVDLAVKSIDALKSVSADVLQKVDMLDQKFELKGRYRKGVDRRIYLFLKVFGLPDANGEVLQVCDGQFLWDYVQVLDNKTYRKIEVGPIFEKLKAPDLDDQVRQSVMTSLGYAGPESLLKGLRQSIRFDQPKATETYEGKECWVLRGEWKNRAGLYGPNQPAPPATDPLPAFVPSLAIVWIGKADGWPYRVRLVGKKPAIIRDTRPVGPDGRPIGAKSTIQQVKPTVIDLTYSNVQFNVPLEPDPFVYTPPSTVRVEDNTAQIVGFLDQAIQLSAAKKKAEAAKAGDDPLLKESLQVPRPAGSVPAAPEALPAAPGQTP